MSGTPPPRLHLLGDAALLYELPAPATLAQQQRIWALAERARQWPGVGETLPGMNNLTLTFDPTAIDRAGRRPCPDSRRGDPRAGRGRRPAAASDHHPEPWWIWPTTALAGV